MTIADSLEKIIGKHPYSNNQWEYYFVESFYPIQKCNILEIRWNNNDDVRLLQSKTIIGYHLELRTTYLKKFLEKNLEINPFKSIDFIWAKTANGHPGICLKGLN